MALDLPHQVTEVREEVTWDASRGRTVAHEVLYYGEIALESCEIKKFYLREPEKSVCESRL